MPELMTPQALCDYLNGRSTHADSRPEDRAKPRPGEITKNTLYQWHHKNYGPTPIRVGRHLRYPRTDVDAWLANQMRTA